MHGNDTVSANLEVRNPVAFPINRGARFLIYRVLVRNRLGIIGAQQPVEIPPQAVVDSIPGIRFDWERGEFGDFVLGVDGSDSMCGEG